MNKRVLQWLIPCWLAALCQAQEQPKLVIEPLTPTAQSEVTGNLESGWLTVTNGVVVRYGTNAVLTARAISVNEKTGETIAQGEVCLQNENRVWRGERLHYNFRTRELQADTFRMGVSPFFAAGDGLSISNQTYIARNAFFTTDDVSEPAYRIRARSLKITPGESIEAEHATVYLGNVPVGFFPFYRRSLARHPNFFTFTPGYRSIYGPYLLGSYHWYGTTNWSAALHLDYRQKRGVGAGPDIEYDLNRFGHGLISGYYLRDAKPGEDLNGRPNPENRYRISFSHQATIRSNLTATIAVRKQSDALVIRDFFETEYRADPQPKSFLEVNQLWPNFSLDVLAQPQLNSFFQTVERLPDIKLSALRQRLGVSPFYYEGENSFAYLHFQPSDTPFTNEFAAMAPPPFPFEAQRLFNVNVTNDYAAMRADSFHQLLLPMTLGGWLNVTPRVGARFTHYGETEGNRTTLNDENRGVFNTGAEVSFKASRVWNNTHNHLFEVDGLRHIIEPSLNYVFVPSPNRTPRELPQFDTDLPSLRLRPIDFPDFNSIDAIDSQNVLRLGLRNKIQTKRNGAIDNFANWALVTDLRIDPRDDQGRFSDVFSDLDFKPRSWLMLSSEIRYDVEDTDVRMANHTITLAPNDVWSVALGHRFFREDPELGPLSGNNLIRSSIFYRFNENWAARMTHHYEARDGVLEEQYYTIYRDLRSWTAALTFRIRDHRTGPEDFTVALTFSLKAFPRFGLGKDRAKHSLLLGG